ncbi:MAG TPA: RNA polymerase sigma factor SigJ [Mycobacteriales bacterium]|nr:RNA polymerase sigma factor SigJ [Mycobacteriales bacterium]
MGFTDVPDGVPRWLVDDHALAEEFHALRPRLLRVAYATVGTIAEAEDCVQEAWLRLRRLEDPATIRDLGAWLTTTVTRLALDVLGSARARREQYVGPWLPEPLVEDIDARDPAERIALEESVSMALLVTLERLSPAERTAFVLHDVFGLSFTEAGEVLGRSAAAVRQLASRARRHVEAGRPRFPPTHAEQRAVVAAFATACEQGDVEQLVQLLDPDVVWRGDGGGKVTALHRILRGRSEVVRGLLPFARRASRGTVLAEVNDSPGLVLRDSAGILTVVAFTVDSGRIAAIDAVRNPDKLRSVRFEG